MKTWVIFLVLFLLSQAFGAWIGFCGGAEFGTFQYGGLMATCALSGLFLAGVIWINRSGV